MLHRTSGRDESRAPTWRESARVEQRVRSEIRLARRVRHRNVSSVYGDGEDRGG